MPLSIVLQSLLLNWPFFPPVWPIRTRHGPYNWVSGEKHSEKGHVWSLKRRQIIISTQTKNKKPNQKRPANPPARFAFRQKAKQRSNKERGRAQTNNQTNHSVICQGCSVTASSSKTITQLTLCQVTTSEVDDATKLLEKARQKLQGIKTSHPRGSIRQLCQIAVCWIVVHSLPVTK